MWGCRQLLQLLRRYDQIRSTEVEESPAPSHWGATEAQLTQLRALSVSAGSASLSDCCPICLATFEVGNSLLSVQV